MRPSRFTKKILYPSLLLIAISGITWLIGHYFLEIQGEFGPEKHPLEIWSLRLHGFFAMFGLLCLGMLLEHHIKTYLKHPRRWWTGLPLLAVWIWLVISGYLLYYLIDDQWHNAFSLGHWIVGLISVLAAYLHIVGKKY